MLYGPVIDLGLNDVIVLLQNTRHVFADIKGPLETYLLVPDFMFLGDYGKRM